MEKWATMAELLRPLSSQSEPLPVLGGDGIDIFVTATPQRNQASTTRSYIPWKYETRMRDMVVRDIDDDVRRVRVGYIRA